MRTATTMTIAVMTHSPRKVDSMCFFSTTPRTTMGIVPMTTSHAARQSTSESGGGRGDNDEKPRLGRVDLSERPAVHQAAEEAGQKAHDVAKEVDDRRDPRTELDDRRSRGAGVAPAQKHRNDLEMRCRTDRDELGKTLNNTQHDCFDD